METATLPDNLTNGAFGWHDDVNQKGSETIPEVTSFESGFIDLTNWGRTG